MSNEQSSISNAEWKVMKIFWSNGEMMLTQVLANLEYTGWGKTTIQTYLSRLVKKGVLETEKQGRGFIYRPLIDEKDCQLKESKKFLDVVFDGSINNMVFNFLNTGKLSEKEISQLKDIINQQQEEDDG